MNCPMKKLLMEPTATTPATIARNNTKTSVIPTTERSCVDSNLNNIATGRNRVSTECCALLAFKYIADCEDVIEFQRKVREVMRK